MATARCIVGSDALALAPLTRQITYLEEGDWAVVTAREVAIFDRANAEGRAPGARDGAVRRADRQGQLPPFHAEGDLRAAGGDRRHAARAGQPGDPQRASARSAVRARRYRARSRSSPAAPRYHAGLVAKYWLERIARIPVEVDIASEFRYRAAADAADGAALVISQSGETADTLAALRYCREPGRRSSRSSTSRKARSRARPTIVLPTLAGPEIGVASTKAFTTQLAVLAALTVALARARGTHRRRRRGGAAPASWPRCRRAPARCCTTTSAIARDRRARSPQARDVLYLGRGTAYPLALEGALKLKEISYIHAEGYAAGEMKHGPIALIDENVPVIVLAPPDDLFEKTASNVEEVMARGGRVVLISDARRRGAARRPAWRSASRCRTVDPFVAPLLYADPGPAARLPRRRAQRHRRRPAAQPRQERHRGVGARSGLAIPVMCSSTPRPRSRLRPCQRGR